MRFAFTISAVVSAFTLAAFAPSDPGSPSSRTDAAGAARQCFYVHNVRNFQQGRPEQIFLRVGRSDIYELSGAGGCPDTDFALQLALIPDGGSVGSRLCSDDWARIVVPRSAAASASLASVCRVRVSRKLSAEEVAAIPARQRP